MCLRFSSVPLLLQMPEKRLPRSGRFSFHTTSSLVFLSDSESRLVMLDALHCFQGGHMRKSDIEKIQKKIWECYFQSQMPIFINVTR